MCRLPRCSLTSTLDSNFPVYTQYIYILNTLLYLHYIFTYILFIYNTLKTVCIFNSISMYVATWMICDTSIPQCPCKHNVDPVTWAKAHAVQRSWLDAKAMMLKRMRDVGRQMSHSYLNHFCWNVTRKNSNDLLVSFLEDVRSVYH